MLTRKYISLAQDEYSSIVSSNDTIFYSTNDFLVLYRLGR